MREIRAMESEAMISALPLIRYSHSITMGAGKLDHLVLYRPNTGTIWILKKNNDGNFSPVYPEGDPGHGIGGYDLRSPADRVFAFDYDGSGKLDHLVLYRPNTRNHMDT